MAAYLSNSLMKRNSHGGNRRRVRGRMAQSLTEDQTPTEEEEMMKRCRAASCCRSSSVCCEYQQLSSSLSQQVSSMFWVAGIVWGVVYGDISSRWSHKETTTDQILPWSRAEQDDRFKPLTSLLSAVLFIVARLKHPARPLGADITDCLNAETIFLVYYLFSACPALASHQRNALILTLMPRWQQEDLDAAALTLQAGCLPTTIRSVCGRK